MGKTTNISIVVEVKWSLVQCDLWFDNDLQSWLCVCNVWFCSLSKPSLPKDAIFFFSLAGIIWTILWERTSSCATILRRSPALASTWAPGSWGSSYRGNRLGICCSAASSSISKTSAFEFWSSTLDLRCISSYIRREIPYKSDNYYTLIARCGFNSTK